MNDLEKLFLSVLKGMYDAEQQIVKALPAMVKHASSDQLKTALQEHLEDTKDHVHRLEEVFRHLGKEPDRMSCKAMEGIIDQGELMLKEFEKNSAIDAALIAAAQQVEHFEIATYGTLCTWAKELGWSQPLTLLKENMSEEKEADEKLSQLAEGGRNSEAARRDTEKRSETGAILGKLVSSGP